MKRIMPTLLFMFLLSACTTTQPTLEEKLAGKTEAERIAILNNECLKEASRHYGRAVADNAPHERRTKELCQTMSIEMKSLSEKDGNDQNAKSGPTVKE